MIIRRSTDRSTDQQIYFMLEEKEMTENRTTKNTLFIFPMKFSELHPNTWKQWISEHRYCERNKRELIPAGEVALMLDWSDEKVAGYGGFWRFEFEDGMWIYPVEVKNKLKVRWKQRERMEERRKRKGTF